MPDEIILAADGADHASPATTNGRSAIALIGVADLWANATTDQTSSRRRDLIGCVRIQSTWRDAYELGRVRRVEALV